MNFEQGDFLEALFALPNRRGRPRGARNHIQRAAGMHEPVRYSDRCSWSRFRHHCDIFLVSRGLKPN